MVHGMLHFSVNVEVLGRQAAYMQTLAVLRVSTISKACTWLGMQTS